MLLKKTKKGKFSFELDWHSRQLIHNAISIYVIRETSILRHIPMSFETERERHITVTAAHQFFQRCSAKFLAPNRTEHFLLSRLEALVLVHIMSNQFNDNMQLVNFRNELLKALS